MFKGKGQKIPTKEYIKEHIAEWNERGDEIVLIDVEKEYEQLINKHQFSINK